MGQSELTEAYCARTVPEASLVAQMLEASGIRSQVVNATLQNAVGDLPYMAVLPRIWVWEEDLERAKTLIQQHFRSSPAGDTPSIEWKCPRCDEVNAPAFDECWKCACLRPGVDQSEDR